MRRQAQQPAVIAPPHRHSQLLTQPLLCLTGGALPALFVALPLGWQVALWLGLAFGLVLTAVCAHAVWFSSYGSALGLALAVGGVCVAVVLGGGAAGFLLLFLDEGDGRPTAGPHRLGWPVFAAGALCVCATAAVAALREWLALADQQQSHPWVQAAVSVDQGRVSEAQPEMGRGQRVFWKVLAVGTALPMLVLAAWQPEPWGGQALVLLWVALLGGTALGVGRAGGARIAQAAYLRGLEHIVGRRFVHPRLAQLQALRSSFMQWQWLRPQPGWPGRWGLGSLQLVCAFGFITAVVLGPYAWWPAWDQWRRFDGFRPAELVVVGLYSTRDGLRSWGRINGQELRFGRGEVNPVLGLPKGLGLGPDALAALQAQLPLSKTVLWNPNAQRRLLPVGTTRVSLWHEVEITSWFMGLGLAAGGVFGGLAWIFKPGPRRSKKRRQKSPALGG